MDPKTYNQNDEYAPEDEAISRFDDQGDIPEDEDFIYQDDPSWSHDQDCSYPNNPYWAE